MNMTKAGVFLLIASLATGCARLHPPTPSPTGGSVNAGPFGFFGRMLPCFGGKKPPPPPRATALIRVGTVKSLSNDGTYAVIKLEPGMLVQGGTELFVTATGSEPARLRAAESQPPYFLADIIAGKVEPGDPVQR